MILTYNNGITVAPNQPKKIAEKLIELYSDQKKLRLFGKNSFKALSEKYNLDQTTTKFVTLFKK